MLTSKQEETAKEAANFIGKTFRDAVQGAAEMLRINERLLPKDAEICKIFALTVITTLFLSGSIIIKDKKP